MARRSQFDLWLDTFQPIRNHLALPGDERGFDGCLFETFGKEVNHVVDIANSPDAHRVWTVVEADNGKWYIASGYHYVNRVGYLITAIPLDTANPIHVRRYMEKDVLYL